jgi:CRP-like cAMP-binding protein
MMFIYFILPSCDEADYFYVVQSSSFQVSKTEAAASAEKILGWDARDARDAPAEDFKHVQPMV